MADRKLDRESAWDRFAKIGIDPAKAQAQVNNLARSYRGAGRKLRFNPKAYEALKAQNEALSDENERYRRLIALVKGGLIEHLIEQMRNAIARAQTPEDAIVEFFRPFVELFQKQAESEGQALNHGVQLVLEHLGTDDKCPLGLREDACGLRAVLFYAGGGSRCFATAQAVVGQFRDSGLMTPEIGDYILNRVKRVTEIRPARGGSNTSFRNVYIWWTVRLAGIMFDLNQKESIRLVSRALYKLGIGVDEDTIQKEVLSEHRAKRRPKRQPKRQPPVGQI
jgi:hypothetical protein